MEPVERQADDERDEAQADERQVAALLTGAGPRPQPARAAHERARAAAHAAWREGAAGRRGRPAVFGLAALAAALVLGVLWAAPELRRLGRPASVPAAPQVLARVERLSGSVSLGPGGAPGTLRAGAPLVAAQAIETGLGRVALRLAGGSSVRLDHHSRLALVGPRHVRLERGAVYVDTGGDERGTTRAALRVETSAGVAQDVGTQFEVRLTENGLRLRVREGAVRFERPRASDTAHAGEELELRDELRRRPVATHGEAWDWTLDVAPAFELEGRSAAEFLRWVAREGGWRLVYTDQAAAQAAERARLHGSIEGASLDEALRTVLPTCRLDFERRGDRLVVARSEAP